MNKDQQELTLEESVKQVMQTLPPVIRDYLSRGKYTPIARSLMAKYGLRIDQGGILERGMMLLLMGIEDPAEFSKALVEEAKLDQQTVNGIMQDINEQIFVPLRDEMRKVAPSAPEVAKPIVPQPQQPAKPSVPAVPAGAAATPPRQLLAGANLPQILIPAPPSQKPALRDVLASVMKAPFVPQNATPPTPLNLPGAPLAPAPESRTQPPKPLAPAASAKPYSIDPYREPLDEK